MAEEIPVPDIPIPEAAILDTIGIITIHTTMEAPTVAAAQMAVEGAQMVVVAAVVAEIKL